MTQISDEQLMAYADGELSPAEVQVLEARLAHDAALRARLQPFILTRTSVASAFEPTLHEPIPDRLVAAIARSPRVASPAPKLPSSRQSPSSRLTDVLATLTAAVFPHGLSLATAASIAALLAVGAGAGWLAAGRTDPAPGLIAVAGQTVVASGQLAHALETAPSSAATNTTGIDGTSVRPVLTFRAVDDSVCREYRIQTGAAGPDFSGLACRTPDGAWHVALHIETPVEARPAPDAYQTATGLGVTAIDALIEAMMSGDALGSSDETELMANGWRPR